MSDENLKLAGEAKKQTKYMLTRSDLRSLRERASAAGAAFAEDELFGSSYGDYHDWVNEPIDRLSISKSQVLLIQCAIYVPGVIEYLSQLSGFSINSQEGEKIVTTQPEQNKTCGD